MAGLLDFLQSASNEAAGTVSAPVDGLAWLLRRAGVPVGDAPIGGSDWMQAKGLTRPVKQSPEQLAGATAGLLSPGAAAAKAPQIAGGLLQAGKNLAAGSSIPRIGERGMILYHGTGSIHPLREITDKGGVANGLFASPRIDAALSHGDALYRMTVPDAAIHGPGSMEDAIEAAGKAGAKAFAAIKKEVGDDLARHVANGTEPAGISGDMSWHLQRLRGNLAKQLGFKAVGTYDEHGTSYLVSSGTGVKPRPANSAAKEIYRGNWEAMAEAKRVQDEIANAANQSFLAREAERVRGLSSASVAKWGKDIDALPFEHQEEANRLASKAPFSRKARSDLNDLLRRWRR